MATAEQGNNYYAMAGNYAMVSGGVGLLQAGVGLMSASNQKRLAKVQSEQIKLQALERSNMLLEQFNSALGNVNFNATRRGVKAGEGSVRQNIELSAKDLGEDLDKARTSANIQAKTTLTSGKIKASAMKTSALSGLVSSALSMQQGNQLRNTTIQEGLY